MERTERSLNVARHPIQALRQFLSQQQPRLTLEFSRYIHLGLGRTLSRETFHVEGSLIDDAWFANELDRLSQGQELALHSTVTKKDRTYHLPMVDFAKVSSLKKLKTRIQTVRQTLPVDIALYSSGRSLHGYFFCLLDDKSWHQYLGRLLLCNPALESQDQLVDTRWVGHSLEHGFSALRWSCNSAIYQSAPRLVEVDAVVQAISTEP